GAEESILGSAVMNLRMPGQYIDEETGRGSGSSLTHPLYYNYNRDYDPATGRYTQVDPIGLAGGVNTYAYANGSPKRYIDLDGLLVRNGEGGIIDRIWDDFRRGWRDHNREDYCPVPSGPLDPSAPLPPPALPSEKSDGEPGDGSDKGKEPSRPGKMQKEVEKGQAPKDVDRVDPPHIDGQEPHIHYKDGTSSNQSGSTHDKYKGSPNPSNKTRKWLKKHGWTPPLKS
ncbi:hypothetical protein WH95_06430, partial [Kiloniella litopenaei]